MPEGTWIFVGTRTDDERGPVTVARGTVVVWSPASAAEVERLVRELRSDPLDLDSTGVTYFRVPTGRACVDYTLAGQLLDHRGRPVPGAPATLGGLLRSHWGDVHLVTQLR